MVVRTNYVPNPRMENSTTGWTPAGTGVTQTAAPGGTVINFASALAAMNPFLYSTTAIAALPGEVWGSSIELTVPAGYPGLSIRVMTVFYNVGANLGNNLFDLHIPSGGTATLTTTPSAAPATTNGIRMWITLLTPGTPAGGRVIVRNALLEKASTVGSYFDGSTPPSPGLAYAWLGTPDNSASTQTSFPAIENMSNNGKKLWWFGHEAHFEAVPAPASGAQVQNVGFSSSMDYVAGRLGISRSMQTHKVVSLDFPVQEASGAHGLDHYTRFAQGYWGDCDSYPMFLADPMLFDQNLLPPNWASPGIIRRGWADISPNGARTYDNLVTNPSAEVDLTGFAAINGTSGVTTLTRPDLGVNAPSGRFVARTTWTTATTAVSGGISYTGIPAIVGFIRGYSIAVRSSKIQRVQMIVRFRDAGSVGIGTTLGTATVLAANTNTRLEVPSATPPAGAVTADIEVVAVAGTSGTNWAIGNTLDGDAVMVYPVADAPPTYFDGDTPGAFWTGDRHDSTSRLYVPRRQPVFSDTGANSYDQPPTTATFQIENTPLVVPGLGSDIPYALIPIPPGYALWLGASGSATGSAQINVNIMNSGSTPALMTANLLPLQLVTSPTRLSNSYSGGEYAKIFLGRTTSAVSTLTLTSMMAQLWPIGVTPVTTGDHIPGAGYRGMKFMDEATVEEYVMVDRYRNVPVRYKGMSTTLAEAQDRG